jgi:hypothetical protein
MLKVILLSVLFVVHPVHVTLFSIEYSADNKLFDGYLRVYYDDFLLDFKSSGNDMALPDVSADPVGSVKSIENYLAGKVGISAGMRSLRPEITKLSLKDNELTINVVFRMKGKSSVFTVKNAILADIYPDQSNLLIFRYGNFEDGIKLTPEKRDHSFKVK